MHLRLIREPSINGATLGSLYIDRHWALWTLEDELREVGGQPVSTWKVPAQTAIPAGLYRLVVTPSMRFKQRLPLLVDVPGFTGIRIHAGNRHQDSEGCILVGRGRGEESVLQSRLALDALVQRLEGTPDPILITVENPPEVPATVAAWPGLNRA